MAGEPVRADVYRTKIRDMALASAARTIVEVGVYAGDLSRLLAALPSVERWSSSIPGRRPMVVSTRPIWIT